MTEEIPDTDHPARGFIVGVVLLAAIAYAGLYAAFRMNGFRTYVEERLEARLGLPVAIQKVYGTAGLNLVMEQVASSESDKLGRPGFRAREVRIEWSLRGLVTPKRPMVTRLVLDHPVMAFAPREEGGWAPVALERLGTWLAEWGGFQQAAAAPAPATGEADSPTTTASTQDVAKAETLSASFWEQIDLEVEGGRLTWWDGAGNELAGAEGVRLLVTHVELPTRPLTHYYLSLDDGRLGPNRPVRQFTFEMLKAGDQQIILGLAADWQPAPAKPDAMNVE